MTLAQILQDQTYSHRTQISLSNSMYKRLMKEKKEHSLAELIRKIIIKYWQQEEEEMRKRQQALQILSQGIPGSGPSREELMKWQTQLRQEKELDE